jgi:hypothetical protein
MEPIQHIVAFTSTVTFRSLIRVRGLGHEQRLPFSSSTRQRLVDRHLNDLVRVRFGFEFRPSAYLDREFSG